jgi:hypothetical protein
VAVAVVVVADREVLIAAISVVLAPTRILALAEFVVIKIETISTSGNDMEAQATKLLRTTFVNNEC